MPAGYYMEFGGQFESLQGASKRLAIVVPLCFAGLCVLLYMALGGFGRATAVFLAVPLGLAGGVFTLAMTGINFSVSAAVGFICLAGVAVLNGLVVMSRSEEHTSELQSLMRISYAVFCLKKKNSSSKDSIYRRTV